MEKTGSDHAFDGLATDGLLAAQDFARCF